MPVHEIAVKAGVGVGTVYHHFPQRADRIAAVFRRNVTRTGTARECTDSHRVIAKAALLARAQAARHA